MFALDSNRTVKTGMWNLAAQGRVLPSGGTALIGMVGMGTLESGISGSNR